MPVDFLTMPQDDLFVFFLLSDDDRRETQRQRDPQNRLGYALQLCILALNQHLWHQGQSSALTCGRATMTNRVSGNGLTISAVKSIEGLPENTLSYRLHPMW